MSNQPDICIIGGGIAALATAWQAITQGLSVAVAYQPRHGAATHAAAGMLAPAFEADTAEQPLIDLSVHSCSLYPQWVASIEKSSGLSCGYQTEGTLFVAHNRDHVSDLQQLAQQQAALGLQCERLSSKRLRQLESSLTPRIVGGLWAPNDHRINPRQLQRSLVEAIKKHAPLYEADRIQLLCDDQRCIGIELLQSGNAQRILSRHTVVADGAWSKQQQLLPSLPIRPVKGQYLILHGDNLIQRTVRSPDVYLVPRGKNLYVGATMQEEGFDNKIVAGYCLDLLFDAYQVIPAIYDLQLQESAVGFRPALRDHQPAIGQTAITDLYISVGHFRHGILIAPAAAEFLLHCIQHKTTGDFSPLRFENNLPL